MIARRTRAVSGLVLALAVAWLWTVSSPAESSKSELVDSELQSKNFAGNRAGVSPIRRIAVYLPAGYKESGRRYPVIYLLPNPLDGNYRGVFDQRQAQELFDRAIASA